MPIRKTYEESCQSLQQQGWLKIDGLPPMPAKPPAYDDEVLGVEFFRTQLDGKLGADFEQLTLPRTYFGRTEVIDISFASTDLSESVANWNDFTNVDFSEADLSLCDFRATNFVNVKFDSCNLKGADLRCCGFETCTFSEADMNGTKMTRATGTELPLSEKQSQTMDWHEDDGDEPGGG